MILGTLAFMLCFLAVAGCLLAEVWPSLNTNTAIRKILLFAAAFVMLIVWDGLLK